MNKKSSRQHFPTCTQVEHVGIQVPEKPVWVKGQHLPLAGQDREHHLDAVKRLAELERPLSHQPPQDIEQVSKELDVDEMGEPGDCKKY